MSSWHRGEGGRVQQCLLGALCPNTSLHLADPARARSYCDRLALKTVVGLDTVGGSL